MTQARTRIMKGTAIITGADGGMGTEITRAVAAAGYHVIMLCYTKIKGTERKSQLVLETGNTDIDVYQIDLSSLESILEVTGKLLQRLTSIELLMNNAGTLSTHFAQTNDGFERTVAVNYLAPFVLTNRLVPLMHEGTRVVNMVSCTYAIGKTGSRFFTHGSDSNIFWRIPVYSNSKYALWMFTYELSERLKEKGVRVNAADPGIVSTNIIRMDIAVIDWLADIFFRPIIRTPRQGADTAIRLLLDEDKADITGQLFASGKSCRLKPKFTDRTASTRLWEETAAQLTQWSSTQTGLATLDFSI